MGVAFEVKQAFYGKDEGRFFEAGDRFEVDSPERVEALRSYKDFLSEIPSAEPETKPETKPEPEPKKASGKRG